MGETPNDFSSSNMWWLLYGFDSEDSKIGETLATARAWKENNLEEVALATMVPAVYDPGQDSSQVFFT